MQPTPLTGTETAGSALCGVVWGLQPTPLTGTETYVRLFYATLIVLQPTPLTGTETIHGLAIIKELLLQPTPLTGTETQAAQIMRNSSLVATHTPHGDRKRPESFPVLFLLSVDIFKCACSCIMKGKTKLSQQSGSFILTLKEKYVKIALCEEA